MKNSLAACFALFMFTLKKSTIFLLKRKSECIAKGYTTLFLLFRFLICLFWSLRHDINLKIGIVPVLYLKFAKRYSACPNTLINVKIVANTKTSLKSANKKSPLFHIFRTVHIIQKNVKRESSFFPGTFGILHVSFMQSSTPP